MNVGGEVERTTYVVDVPDDLIPIAVRELIQRRADGKPRWEAMSMSVVR